MFLESEFRSKKSLFEMFSFFTPEEDEVVLLLTVSSSGSDDSSSLPEARELK